MRYDKPNILQWVAIWFLAVLLSALVFRAAKADAQIASGAEYTPQHVYKCQAKVVGLVDRSVMSQTTARRYALRLCKKLRDGTTEERYLYRAIVRQGGSR